MARKLCLFALLNLLTFYLHLNAQDSIPDWTHFRGSKLDCLATGDNYPVTWNDSTNISWKVPIPGRGWSSPVVFGNQVWLTTATIDGKELSALCLDLYSGKILYYITLFAPDSIYKTHPVNSFATPTPCMENGFVYAHFGRYGTACINSKNGEIVWKRNDLLCNHWEGPGSSPILHGDNLILHLEGIDVQYIIALDKRTGKTVWKKDRPAELYESLIEAGRKSFVTPILMKVNGKEHLISNGAPACIAYDPYTGQEIWRVVRGEHSTISMPFTDQSKVYYYTSQITPGEGMKYSELLAINPAGTGNITETNIMWKKQAPLLQLLTPVIKNGLIYTIDSNSMILCLDAGTGEVVWSDRMRGKFNSSPVAASGNIYFSSTQGFTYVIKEGRKMQILAENKLDGEIWATPAFVEGAILLRTSKYLYKIGLSSE